MPSDAPSALARSIFSSLEDVTITRAPAARANCMASMDTPPVPWHSTVSPAFTRFPITMSAFQAVTPAQGSVAASSNERFAGSATTPSSCREIYSASVPSSGTPSAGGRDTFGPSFQTWKKVPATLSPGRKRVTPGPIDTTSPAPSDNGMTSRSTTPLKYCPVTIRWSR